MEHLSWTMSLMLLNGIFFPKFTATMGCIVFVGRELYRYGYMSKDGPNSTIRELGAVPLNAAEFLIIGGLLFTMSRYMFGPFIARRKIVQRFTTTPYDKHLKEVIKKESKKGNL